MASLTHHIYAVRNYISRGASSDDSKITNSLIRHTLNSARSVLLRRRMDKYEDISSVNYQKICVTLEDTNPSECALMFTLPQDCEIKKSTSKIPPRISARWGAPTRILYLDGRRMGQLTSAAAFDAKHSLTRPDQKGSYFFQENYLYVIGNKNLKKVQILDLFEDPTEADMVSTCETLTENWPLDPDLTTALYQITLEMLGFTYKIPEDTTNNAQDVQLHSSTKVA